MRQEVRGKAVVSDGFLSFTDQQRPRTKAAPAAYPETLFPALAWRLGSPDDPGPATSETIAVLLFQAHDA